MHSEVRVKGRYKKLWEGILPLVRRGRAASKWSRRSGPTPRGSRASTAGGSLSSPPPWRCCPNFHVRRVCMSRISQLCKVGYTSTNVLAIEITHNQSSIYTGNFLLLDQPRIECFFTKFTKYSAFSTPGFPSKPKFRNNLQQSAIFRDCSQPSQTYYSGFASSPFLNKLFYLSRKPARGKLILHGKLAIFLCPCGFGRFARPGSWPPPLYTPSWPYWKSTPLLIFAKFAAADSAGAGLEVWRYGGMEAGRYGGMAPSNNGRPSVDIALLSPQVPQTTAPHMSTPSSSRRDTGTSMTWSL